MEMQQNNSPDDMNYRPEMMMMQQQPQMMDYSQQQQMPMQMPRMPQMPPQMAPPQMQPQMVEQDMQEMPDLDEPDLSKYGMEAEGSGGFMDNLFEELKAPVIVVILAFLMGQPQVNGVIRTNLNRFTMNNLYISIIMALIIGVVFYAIMKFLF
jgi:hypothetical protein